MDLTLTDIKVAEALCGGLALVADPYAELGRRVGLSENEVLNCLTRMIDGGVIKRFGVIVQHRKLGYTANGMSVWNVPDDLVKEVGASMGAIPCVTLCYRRPRHLPDWPYNLFAMVHGSDRDTVLQQVADIADVLDLEAIPRDVLFSSHQFKQCGARYDCKGRDDDEPCSFD